MKPLALSSAKQFSIDFPTTPTRNSCRKKKHGFDSQTEDMILSLPLAQPIEDKTAGLLNNEPYPHRTTNPQLNGQNGEPTLAEGRLEITDYTSTINSGEPGAHETSNGLLKLVDDGFRVEFEGTEVCGEDNLKLSSVLHSEVSDSRNSSIDMEYGDDSEDLATTILKLRYGR